MKKIFNFYLFCPLVWNFIVKNADIEVYWWWNGNWYMHLKKLLVWRNVYFNFILILCIRMDSIPFVRILCTVSSQLSRMVKMGGRSAMNKNPSIKEKWSLIIKEKRRKCVVEKRDSLCITSSCRNMLTLGGWLSNYQEGNCGRLLSCPLPRGTKPVGHQAVQISGFFWWAETW